MRIAWSFCDSVEGGIVSILWRCYAAFTGLSFSGLRIRSFMRAKMQSVSVAGGMLCTISLFKKNTFER